MNLIAAVRLPRTRETAGAFARDRHRKQPEQAAKDGINPLHPHLGFAHVEHEEP
jgi:hypothetical protein